MNRIDTPGYFIKRLRDKGYIVMRIFDKYAPEDSRKWTICVSPGRESIFITCYKWVDEFKVLFEINDGGNKWPRNFYLKTSSHFIISNSRARPSRSLGSAFTSRTLPLRSISL